MAQGQGITSLMPGQAPGPGQTNPMPGMKPPMGGLSAGVVDLVGPLKNLPEQVLTMELMNPQSKLEKYAVLAALDQKNRERKTMQAVQGMMAQQQNAQMQGQGTVAQQVAQEAQGARAPVMAAMGGLMRGYAGGGIVAFQSGGDAWRKRLLAAGVPESFIAEREARGAGAEQIESDAKSAGYMGAQTSPVAPQVNIPSPEQRERSVNQRIEDAIARARAASASNLSVNQRLAQAAQGPQPPLMEIPPVETPLRGKSGDPDVDIGMRPRGKSGIESLDIGTKPPPAVPTPPPSREGAAKTRPVMPPPVTAPAATAPVTTGIPAALQAQFDEQRAALKGQMQKPAGLTEKEAGLDALMQQRIREEEARSAEPTSEAMKALQEALRRRGEFDAGDWFRLAGSIDPRRGYAFKSMGEGLAGIMERKAQSAEAARKELVAAQREQRQLQSKVSELRILAQQEQVLRERGEFDRANAVRDKMFGLEKEVFALQRDIEEKERDYGLKQRQVAAQEKTARAAEISAGRPTDFDKKLKLLKDDPATYRRMYGDEEAEKMLRLRAQLLKDYSANMNTLQLQGINSFEDYAALMGPSLMGASAGMSVPPAGAVREKGK